jgi:outer membrane protein OmpA-like peptidoglycan-associated protein
MIPGLKTETSKDITKSTFGNDAINSTDNTNMLPVPDVNDLEYADMSGKPEVRLMNWVWFGNAGIFSANGGLKTVKGSLMEKFGVNLKMLTNNSVSDMKREQLAFIKEFASGNKNPSTGVHFVTLMGDGYPAYVSAMNEQITKAYGKEYNLKVIGVVGFSMGEDCVMGPAEWKTNPQSMKGSVVSAVIGDGDWALNVRYAADNNIKVNPDPGTYDPQAINFVPAPDDDFLKAADEVIAGRAVTLKEKDAKGNLTGKSIERKIDGAATWFPGDRNIVKNTTLQKIISTKQYPNQMATVVVGCDKWMKENSQTIVNFLSASLTATNQIKQHQPWFQYACKLAPKVFCASAADCSETAEDWTKYAVPNGSTMTNSSGNSVAVGGTQMANLADNKKYFGLSGGNNIYKSVYTYFSSVIKDLNPAGFMDNVKGLTSYDDAVDLQYLGQVNVDAGQTAKADYAQNKGEVFANRAWKIEFASGSDKIAPKGEADLQKLFDALNIAENAKVSIVGHTDNVGDPENNKDLSFRRAKSVKQWLIKRSGGTFPSERFNVDGKGQEEPIADNQSELGKSQNRRVQITLSE